MKVCGRVHPHFTNYHEAAGVVCVGCFLVRGKGEGAGDRERVRERERYGLKRDEVQTSQVSFP